VRRWLEARGETATLAAYRRANERQAQFAALLRETRTRLAGLYASPFTAETMRIEKQREFGLLKFQYERLRHDWGNDAAYDAWFARSLNNAHLAAVATYEDCVPGLRRELETAGSMPEFYRRAEKLGELPLGERRKALCAGATAEASAATTRPGATTGERMPGS
jgi:predicted aminopeptidase